MGAGWHSKFYHSQLHTYPISECVQLRHATAWANEGSLSRPTNRDERNQERTEA